MTNLEKIDWKYKQIEELQHRYGTGVRPAWVGEEIGILYAEISNIESELRKKGK